MSKLRVSIVIAALTTALFTAATTSAQPVLRDEARVMNAVLRWNTLAIDASGLDHMAPAPGENRVAGEQAGPGRASRAMAIVHVAIFEAINAGTAGAFESYAGLERAERDVDVPAAIAHAGHDTLAAMFPAQRAIFAAALTTDMARLPAGGAVTDGVALGRAAASAILSMRANDGSTHAEPRVGVDYQVVDAPGRWSPDPVTNIPVALGAFWGRVRPFVLQRADQFRVPPPPALDSDAYTAAYRGVFALGGDGHRTPTTRVADEGSIGIYWAYDGTPSLCAPPRLYNQVALTVAARMRTSALDVARLLALINVAMADAGIAIWESKYFYDFWRPVTGIRKAGAVGAAPGDGDGNPRTIGDATFVPLGAPASNSLGLNFTPPFPSYPSGHAGFGGAIFQVLREFYGRDDIEFTFVSDEYNGVTLDNTGATRALHPRSYQSFSQAEEENGQSRIYLGIHWAFDKTEGIAQGRKVGHVVNEQLFAPKRPSR